MKRFVTIVLFSCVVAIVHAQTNDIVKVTDEHKARAAELMSKMNLEQKCHVISGLSNGKPGAKDSSTTCSSSFHAF